jgi:hypothetical protein
VVVRAFEQGDDTCFDLVAVLYPGCFILFMSGSIFVCVGQLIAFLAHRGLEERLLRHDAIIRKSSRNSPLYACVYLLLIYMRACVCMYVCVCVCVCVYTCVKWFLFGCGFLLTQIRSGVW